MKKKVKLAALITVGVVALAAAVFLGGRYGWKLFGFSACQSARIEAVTVTEGTVEIRGAYSGIFPEGFIGYYAKEEGGKLSVGFRFSRVFGFFKTGAFDIQIPVQGEIREVSVKTGKNEFPVWNQSEGLVGAPGD